MRGGRERGGERRRGEGRRGDRNRKVRRRKLCKTSTGCILNPLKFSHIQKGKQYSPLPQIPLEALTMRAVGWPYCRNGAVQTWLCRGPTVGSGGEAGEERRGERGGREGGTGR